MRFLLTLTITLALMPSCLMAQTGPATQPALLDHLGELWVKYNRQPTPAEIDASGNFTSAAYLREWQTWEAVRQALAERFYEKGLTAFILGDMAQASDWYRKCLIVDGEHAEARSAFNRAEAGNLKDATRNGAAFSKNLAGPAAAASFSAFVTEYKQGHMQDALVHYQRAIEQKEQYRQSEITRLTVRYEEGVAAFEQKEYKKAIKIFEELSKLKPKQVGYMEVYNENASKIDSSLAQVDMLRIQQLVSGISTAYRTSRFSGWMSLEYYALPPTMGLRLNQVNRLIKIESTTYIGGDIGLGAVLTKKIMVGLTVSKLANSFSAESNVGISKFAVQFDQASMLAISPYLRFGKLISSGIYLYGQTGISFYRIDVSTGRTLLSTISVPAHTENPIGINAGVGSDFFIQAVGRFAWGFKLDLKYHKVFTSEQTTFNQKLRLNGPRISLGMVVAR